jgi:hypothetical protein
LLNKWFKNINFKKFSARGGSLPAGRQAPSEEKA